MSVEPKLSAIEEIGAQNVLAAETVELINTYREAEVPAPDPEMEALIEPLLDRVVVRRIKETEEVKDGIIIPDEAQEKCTDAIVACVGQGRVTDSGVVIPLKVKVGDRVILPHYGLTELEIKGTKYLILREDQIEAIVREPEEK